jgi:hypothetical protein
LVNANTAIPLGGEVLGFLFVQELQHADTGRGEKKRMKTIKMVKIRQHIEVQQ